MKAPLGRHARCALVVCCLIDNMLSIFFRCVADGMPVVEYRRVFMGRAAEELALLPVGLAAAELLSDFAVLRDQARAHPVFEWTDENYRAADDETLDSLQDRSDRDRGYPLVDIAHMQSIQQFLFDAKTIG